MRTWLTPVIFVKLVCRFTSCLRRQKYHKDGLECPNPSIWFDCSPGEKVYHGLPFSPGIAICESAVSSDPILMGGPSGRKYSSLREATHTRHHSSLRSIRSPALAADLQHWPPSQRNVVRDVEKVWPVVRLLMNGWHTIREASLGRMAGCTIRSDFEPNTHITSY